MVEPIRGAFRIAADTSVGKGPAFHDDLSMPELDCIPFNSLGNNYSLISLKFISLWMHNIESLASKRSTA